MYKEGSDSSLLEECGMSVQVPSLTMDACILARTEDKQLTGSLKQRHKSTNEISDRAFKRRVTNSKRKSRRKRLSDVKSRIK